MQAFRQNVDLVEEGIVLIDNETEDDVAYGDNNDIIIFE